MLLSLISYIILLYKFQQSWVGLATTSYKYSILIANSNSNKGIIFDFVKWPLLNIKMVLAIRFAYNVAKFFFAESCIVT